MTFDEIGLWAVFAIREICYFCMGYAVAMFMTARKKRRRNQYAQKID